MADSQQNKDNSQSLPSSPMSASPDEIGLRCVQPHCTCERFIKGLSLGCHRCHHSRLCHDLLKLSEAIAARTLACAGKGEAACRFYGCKCTVFVGDTASRDGLCKECGHQVSDHRVETKEDVRRATDEASASGHACVQETCSCAGYVRPPTWRPSFGHSGPCALCMHFPRDHRPADSLAHAVRKRLLAAATLPCKEIADDVRTSLAGDSGIR